MDENELLRLRLALVQAYLRDRNYDGVLLSRVDNFAMATGGRRNYVNAAVDSGVASLFVPRDGTPSVICDNIEAPRIMEEELDGAGVDARTFKWFEGNAADLAKDEFNGTLVSDTGTAGDNVHENLACLRGLLTETELEKYRRLGKLASEAMVAVLDSIIREDHEADIAARLHAEGAKRRCHVPVCLIAADDRIAKFRHPLPTQGRLLVGEPTSRRVDKYVMVAGCFQREGLVVSMTRFKRLDELPEGIAGGYDRVCAVDAAMQEASQPGKTLGHVFSACQAAYEDFGFGPTEWHNHHQGGLTGYGARTRKAMPNDAALIMDPLWPQLIEPVLGYKVEFGHAFAWNPSAPGVKSEDTFILLPDGGQEIVSATPQLPAVDLDKVLKRPTTVAKSAMSP